MLSEFIEFELIIIYISESARALFFFVTINIYYNYSILNKSIEFVIIYMGESIELN